MAAKLSLTVNPAAPRRGPFIVDVQYVMRNADGEEFREDNQ
jgi:hypothetical protein